MTVNLASTTPSTHRAGIDPITEVHLMENHDMAYHVWRARGFKQKILVHIDAHHDMWWAPQGIPATIANFICPALKEEIVREIFWIVPDRTWDLAKSRRAVLRHLHAILKSYPDGKRGAIQVSDKKISTTVLNKPLTVCSLDTLPSIEEDILLDIDSDYLAIPYVSYREHDRHEALPWCWPNRLVARLRAAALRAKIVTIAYSVEGSYTPLKWKYLGDELAIRLKQAEDNAPALQAMDHMRAAILAAHDHEPPSAEENYRRAIALLPNFAAPYWHLAHLYLDIGRIAQAREMYQQALALDPESRTAYNSFALSHYSERRFRAAEREHRRVLALDPSDAYATFGLARLAIRRRRWDEAESLLRTSLSLNDRIVDAHRLLGDLLARQGRNEEAAKTYERTLKLGLAGCRSLIGPIITDDPNDHWLKDPNHFRVHARLARLCELKGATQDAISSYRMSIAGGQDSLLIRSRLAYLYLRQNEWRKSLREAAQALSGLKTLPPNLRSAARELRRILRLMMKSLYLEATHT